MNIHIYIYITVGVLPRYPRATNMNRRLFEVFLQLLP